MPPVLATAVKVPVPGLNAKRFPVAPMLVPVRVIAPFAALVSTSVVALPCVIVPVAFRVA